MTTNTHIAAQARDLASKASRLGARRFGDALIQCLRECAQALEAAELGEGKARTCQDPVQKCEYQCQECKLIDFAAQAPALDAQGEAAWEGGEGWESLAWELCADEHGEEACNELIWEGGPIPEPWGDRWMKYEGEAKRLIALVHKHVPPPPPAVGKPLSEEEIEEVAVSVLGYGALHPSDMKLFTKSVRAIERAHGIVTKETGT